LDRIHRCSEPAKIGAILPGMAELCSPWLAGGLVFRTV